MTENLQADCVQSRQAGFIQCFLKSQTANYSPSDQKMVGEETA